jgi:hypothetical protein
MRRSVRRRPPRARSIDAIETVVYDSFVAASCVRVFVRSRVRARVGVAHSVLAAANERHFFALLREVVGWRHTPAAYVT